MKPWQLMRFAVVGGAALLLAAGGCRKQEMASQAKNLPLEPSAFFADGASARPLVEGTVPRRSGVADTDLAEPLGERPAQGFPADFPTSGQALKLKLLRGRERYTIYCAVCHGELGDGDGMIARRGFVPPSSFLNDTLRVAPPGTFYDVITYGKGAMYSYADRVAPDDRWSIIAYIRALQFSQNTKVTTLPPQDQRQIERINP